MVDKFKASGTYTPITTRREIITMTGSDGIEKVISNKEVPIAKECQHNFQSWRKYDDGSGAERVCAKCGLGAMAYRMRSSQC